MWNVVLPTSKANDNFTSIVEDLATLGYANARTKYLVLYDDGNACGCGGIGQAPAEDRAASDNAALRGPMYAVSLSLSTRTLMHELSHTMGAVQNSAPHSTHAAHCYDGSDVMCYRDGGSNGSRYSSQYCSSGGLIFDCNKDDYFNAKPRAGSYLATHWNLGSRLNRYIRFPAASDTTPPVISWIDPRAGYTYFGGCASRATTGKGGRPVFQGKGCIRATPTDADTGVDRLDVYFDGRLIGTFRQFPTTSVTFDLGRGPGVGVPLTLVATDFAEIPRGPNKTTTTILVDIV